MICTVEYVFELESVLEFSQSCTSFLVPLLQINVESELKREDMHLVEAIAKMNVFVALGKQLSCSYTFKFEACQIIDIQH